jgi:hypothetical protein
MLVCYQNASSYCSYGEVISSRVSYSCCTVEGHCHLDGTGSVINERRDVSVSHLLGICWCKMGDNNKKTTKMCAAFSITDWGPNQKCMQTLCFRMEYS